MADLTRSQFEKLGFYRDFWRQQIISTEQVDRPAAQGAIRRLYRTLDKPEPEFLWFDAPREATGAARVLLMEQDLDFFERLWGQMERRKRAEWVRIRAMTSSQAGIIGWEETRRRLIPPPLADQPGPRIGFAFLARSLYAQEAAPWLSFGKRYFHFMSAVSDTSPATKEDRRREAQEYERIRKLQTETDPVRMLQEDVDEIEWTCFFSSPAFQPLYAAQAEVETSFLYNDPEFKLRGISFGQLARLEFLSRECGEQFSSAYLALLDVGKQVSLWWALDKVVVVCDRPAQLLRNSAGQLHNSAGPAMVWRNDWKVYAVNGVRSKPLPAPQKQTARRTKASPILRTHLPVDPKERLDLLREAASGRLPFCERYDAGDRVNVWKELVELGERVRSSEHAADGLAVAYATMDRAAHNVGLLVERLNRLRYEFGNACWEKPSSESRKEWREVDRKLGTLPFSLRAWWDVVGGVDLMGDDGLLSNRWDMTSPGLGTLLTDPLVIYGPAVTLSEDQTFEGEPDYQPECVLAPDRYHKHDISGGSPYTIALPCLAADAVILNEANELYLVEYLRLCFRYGGFPGFGDDESKIPQREMAILTEGLLEI